MSILKEFGDIKLQSSRTTPDVFWSPAWERPHGGRGGFNSFVLIKSEQGDWEKDGQKCFLASVNGIGEIRWYVHKYEIERMIEDEKKEWWDHEEYGESLKAARHFGLIPPAAESDQGSVLDEPCTSDFKCLHLNEYGECAEGCSITKV